MIFLYHWNGYSFIHSSIDGHRDCLHVLAIVNSATVNTELHVSFRIMLFLQIYAQEKDCWDIYMLILFLVFFLKEHSYCPP